MKVVVDSVTRIVGNSSLICLVDVTINDYFEIAGCPVLQRPRGPWCALPARPLLDRDGRVQIIDGKRVYKKFVAFRDNAEAERFNREVLGSLRTSHPQLFDGQTAQQLDRAIAS